MPRCASRALDSAEPPRTSLRIRERSSATFGLEARVMRISKLRSGGSPALRRVASSRLMMPMSSWVPLLRLKSGARSLAATAAFAPPASSARIGMSPISCSRATAVLVLDASSTPSCTSPEGVTALYWKNGIARGPCLVLARDAQDFLDGGDARQRLPQAVLEHGLHALGDRRGAQVAGGGVAHDERADAVGHGEHLEDADAAEVAGARAFRATHRLVERDLARAPETAQAHLLHHLRQRGVRLAALGAEGAHQALRE